MGHDNCLKVTRLGCIATSLHFTIICLPSHPSLPSSPPATAAPRVYIKLIDERFIRLMGSAGAEKHPPTKQDLKYKQNNKVARRQLHQQFDMNNFPDVGETV